MIEEKQEDAKLLADPTLQFASWSNGKDASRLIDVMLCEEVCAAVAAADAHEKVDEILPMRFLAEELKWAHDFGSFHVCCEHVCGIANVVSMWMVMASLVYLLMLVGPFLVEWSSSGTKLAQMLGGYLSSGRVVSGASENERLVKWAVGCAESKKAEAAGSKVAGLFGSASRRANRRCASFRGGEVGSAGASARADCRACVSVSREVCR